MLSWPASCEKGRTRCSAAAPEEGTEEVKVRPTQVIANPNPETLTEREPSLQVLARVKLKADAGAAAARAYLWRELCLYIEVVRSLCVRILCHDRVIIRVTGGTHI